MRFADFKNITESPEPDIIRALRDFLPIAVKELKLSRLPTIKFMSTLDYDEQPTFGSFSHDGVNAMIQLNIANRHPVDVLRTLAHELVHYKQFVNKQLGPNSGDTGSSSENEAHVVAGVIMRNFDKACPGYLKSNNISDTTAEFNEGKTTPSSKDKKLANALEDYANKHISEREPGFGDFMYHAELIRKGHKDIHKQDLNTVQRKYRTIMNDMISKHLDETVVVSEGLTYMDPVAKWVAVFKASTHPKFKGKTAEQREKMARMAQYTAVQNKKPIKPSVKENMDHSKDDQAVAELKAALLAHKDKLQGKDSDTVYKIIDQLMTRVAKAHGLTGQQMHDMWVDKYSEIPDTWIMNVLDEEYKDADYARGNVKMPKAKLGRTKHPLHGKLVGGQ